MVSYRYKKFKGVKRPDLEAWYVNAYRGCWGTTTGLDKNRTKKMNRKDMETSILSLERCARLHKR